MWFKKGHELEARTAEGEEVLPTSNLRPIEDAYLDDGSVTREDHQAYSLQTGSTQPIERDPAGKPVGDVDLLVRDLVSGRRAFSTAIIAAFVVAIVVSTLAIV